MMNFETYYELLNLYAQYSLICDSDKWDEWPEFFTDDCVYSLQPRENYERGMPLGLLDLESKEMLVDRVYGIKETLFYDPYYQRHIVGAPHVIKVDGDVIYSEANYSVMRTKYDGMTTVFNAGRYIDEVQKTAEGLKFKSRRAVYDSEMVPNSVIYPV
jgi:salicylate 5-hydroxylase small subunit